MKISIILSFFLVFLILINVIISATFASEIAFPKNAINNQLCGNGVCNQIEQNSGTCPRDCDKKSTKNEVCGDGACSNSERSSGTCSKDCVWGSGCGGG